MGEYRKLMLVDLRMHGWMFYCIADQSCCATAVLPRWDSGEVACEH
jgi:hypothetical protein